MASFRRFAVMQALMLWQGGFLFYTALVVPRGTDVLGSSAAQGAITAQVTDALNITGILAIAVLCWDLVGTRDPSQQRTIARWWCWSITLICQYLLVALHQILDYFMDPQRRVVLITPPFYTAHRVYLWISTVQWLVCLVFTWWTLQAWRAEAHNENTPCVRW